MHSGFNRSWTKNNLNGRVIDRVLQIVRERSPGRQHPEHLFRIMVSGEHRQTLLSTAALWRTPCYDCTAQPLSCSSECHEGSIWQPMHRASGAKFGCPARNFMLRLQATRGSQASKCPQGIRLVAHLHNWRHMTSPLQQLSRTWTSE